MSWICRNCGSENPNEENACLACLKKAGTLYRFSQRLQTPRLGMEDEPIGMDGTMLKRLYRIVCLVLLILCLTGTGLTAFNIIGIAGNRMPRTELDDVWHVRWTQLSTRMTSGQSGSMLQAQKRCAALWDECLDRLSNGCERFSAAVDKVGGFIRRQSAAMDRDWTGGFREAVSNWGAALARADQAAQKMIPAFRSMLDRLQNRTADISVDARKVVDIL
ncbi:MAG: hypothetical protein PUH70_10715 [Clostridiales bacterium]|nr:hypothetical protein [Clostridiales bacterium]MDY5515046.1 hypothetical protein [Candidatus Ventricola sp.]